MKGLSYIIHPTAGKCFRLCRIFSPAVQFCRVRRPRRPVCRGGRLCPPKPRAPCRAGPACPAGKNALLRRDTWVPPYKLFRRGRCPQRPLPSGAALPRCKAPSGRGLSAQPTGGEKMPHFISPSVSASRCNLPRRGRQGENGLPRRFTPRNDSASRRRGRRPAVERSGTNALGVRRPVSAALPRCKAPSGRGLSAQPTGGEKNRMTSLPPSALRTATSLAEGGKGRHTGDTVAGSQ